MAPPTSDQKQKQLTLTMSEEDYSTLKRLADTTNQSVAAWVRAQIRAADRAELNRAVAALETVYRMHQEIVAKPASLEFGVPPRVLTALDDLGTLANAQGEKGVVDNLKDYELALSQGAATTKTGQQSIARTYSNFYGSASRWLRRGRQTY